MTESMRESEEGKVLALPSYYQQIEQLRETAHGYNRFALSAALAGVGFVAATLSLRNKMEKGAVRGQVAVGIALGAGMAAVNRNKARTLQHQASQKEQAVDTRVA